MAEIARTSGGRAHDAQTEQYLSSVYQTLGRSLSTVARKRDASIYFLVAAGVLLLIAALGSVRTAARLPWQHDTDAEHAPCCWSIHKVLSPFSHERPELAFG